MLLALALVIPFRVKIVYNKYLGINNFRWDKYYILDPLVRCEASLKAVLTLIGLRSLISWKLVIRRHRFSNTRGKLLAVWTYSWCQ